VRLIKSFRFNRLLVLNKIAVNASKLIKFIFQWNNSEPINYGYLFISCMGMAGPIFFGILFNHLESSLLAAFGAMFAIRSSTGASSLAKMFGDYLITILVGSVSIYLGSLIGNQNWITSSWIISISILTALVTGLGRRVARPAIQFLVFFIIGTGFGTGLNSHESFQIACLFGLGIIWAVVLSFIFELCIKRYGQKRTATAVKDIPFRRIFNYWMKTLRNFKGWEYPIRMGLCMMAAETAGLLLGQDRSYWIPLTVILVTQRNYSSAIRRIFQRGLGTILGVLIGCILLVIALPHAAVAVIVGVIAAIRPVLKERSYLLYSMLMTPLMVVISSSQSSMTGKILIDRLLDTSIGCIISYLLGYLIWQYKSRGTVQGR